jgi:Sec-independent protein secretion pathway component TatC
MDLGQNKKLLIPYSLNIKQNDAEMSLSDHLEELRQRAFWSVAVLVSSILVCVFSVKSIVKILLPILHVTNSQINFKNLIVVYRI